MGRSIVVMLVALACAMTFADPVDDVRAGRDVDFDLKYMSYTYAGILSGNGSGEVFDSDAPPSLVPKDPGTLDIILDSAALGLPFNIVVPMTGTKLSPTRVRWTTDVTPNQCIHVDLNGTPVDLLIKRIWGQLEATATPINPFLDPITDQPYNVQLDDIGGNSTNWINVRAYLFCTENFFNEVNFQLRNWDYVAYGGVARGRVLPGAYTIVFGSLSGGSLTSLYASDDDRMVVTNGVTFLITQSPVTVELDTAMPTTTLSKLDMVLEGQASLPGITQRLDLWDQVVQTWTNVSEKPASFGSDTVTVATITTGIGDYINGSNRNLRARIRFRDDAPALLAVWQGRIDVAVFDIEP